MGRSFVASLTLAALLSLAQTLRIPHYAAQQESSTISDEVLTSESGETLTDSLEKVEEIVDTGAPLIGDDIATPLVNVVYSELTYMTEIKGQTHWILLKSGQSLVAWNVVRDRAQVLIDDASSVVAFAVDPTKGYLFLADPDTVRLREFSVSLGDDYRSPTITMADTSKIVYRDEGITAIAVDEDHSELFISSLGGTTIWQYAPEILALDETGQVTTLYEEQPTSIAANKYGDLYLSDSKIYVGEANVQGTQTLELESDFFATADKLHYSAGNLFFVGTDMNNDQGIYMKPVEHGQSPSNIIVQVAVGLDSPSGIGTFDDYVYFTDVSGAYAIETFANGTFSQPRPFEMTNVAQTNGPMLTFTLGGQMLAVGFGAAILGVLTWL